MAQFSYINKDGTTLRSWKDARLCIFRSAAEIIVVAEKAEGTANIRFTPAELIQALDKRDERLATPNLPLDIAL